MSFFLGLVIGIVVGLGLIVAFVRSENARSKSRSELVSTTLTLLYMCSYKFRIMYGWLYVKATTVAAFARMTVEDSRKILSPEYYPSWVVFSQQQKFSSLSLIFNFHFSYLQWGPMFCFFMCFIFQLTWLNEHLTKIWPYVDQVNWIVGIL